jgi:hypothetical protein
MLMTDATDCVRPTINLRSARFYEVFEALKDVLEMMARSLYLATTRVVPFASAKILRWLLDQSDEGRRGIVASATHTQNRQG